MKLNDVCLFVSNLFVIYHSEYITASADLYYFFTKRQYFQINYTYQTDSRTWYEDHLQTSADIAIVVKHCEYFLGNRLHV